MELNDNKKIPITEALIKDLYIDLRKKVNKWSKITSQTPQARMGYVGQHLTSIVTGYPGGKSGARGYDLIIDQSHDKISYAEIKTCYRVDQLGKCLTCGSVVSSLEKSCSFCNSTNIKRNDDSKWLITMLNENDIILTFEPDYYYFVLFEFQDISNPLNNNILTTIWRVKTTNPGFIMCMLDYYFNIRSKSKSKAPFNMWPHMLKYQLTKPVKIYQSIIYEDDSIETLFLNNSNSEEDKLLDFTQYSSSNNLNLSTLHKIYELRHLEIPSKYEKKKKKLLEDIYIRIQKNMSNSDFADLVSYAMYYDRIKPFFGEIPTITLEKIKNIEDINF